MNFYDRDIIYYFRDIGKLKSRKEEIEKQIRDLYKELDWINSRIESEYGNKSWSWKTEENINVYFS